MKKVLFGSFEERGVLTQEPNESSWWGVGSGPSTQGTIKQE